MTIGYNHSIIRMGYPASDPISWKLVEFVQPGGGPGQGQNTTWLLTLTFGLRILFDSLQPLVFPRRFVLTMSMWSLRLLVRQLLLRQEPWNETNDKTKPNFRDLISSPSVEAPLSRSFRLKTFYFLRDLPSCQYIITTGHQHTPKEK